MWIGFFDRSGSPALKIKIRGPFAQPVEFDAIIDTGFTGFISMPLLRALPLGLMLYGTVSVELADGSKSTKLTARGLAEVESDSEVGVIVLEPAASDILIGMAFLRIFKKGLFVTQNLVFLVDQSRTPDPDPEQPESEAELSPIPEPQAETPPATS
jgi:predicted aspartyl protease